MLGLFDFALTLGILRFSAYTVDAVWSLENTSPVKNSTLTSALARAALLLAALFATLWAAPSYASQRCEELVANRYCTDSAPKTYYSGTAQATVPAPIIDGFPTACWSWTRQFQCIETEPTFSCVSGTPYATVQADCSLTSAVTHATQTINGVSYITSATYNYACAWGEWTTDDTLKPNRECVMLDSEIKNTKIEKDPITGAEIITEQNRDDKYVCYLPPVTNCADKCYAHVTDPKTGKIVDKEVACSGSVTNCAVSSKQCEGTYSFNAATQKFETTQELGPDGRCVLSTEDSMCSGGAIPRCLSDQNCTLTGTTPTSIQPNGIALGQEQNYVCSNTTKSCAQTSNVSNCVHVSAWGWDDMGLQNQIGQGLDKANEALAKLEGIEKGQKTDDPYIFSGMDLRCHYAVGNFLNTFITIAAIAVTAMATGGASLGLMASALQSVGFTAAQAVAIQVGAAFVADAPNSKAFGADCCKDYIIEGSDAWYKLGSCTADEVKLAVARQKDLDVYLGEYCSKKSGFPVRQCVEKTRTFCVFDDMLALTVNEQGRQQLDALALADPIHTTTSNEIPSQLFNTDTPGASKYAGILNNGRWIKQTTESKSQIWTWQFPGYCSSTTRQAAAYTTFMNELNSLADTKGIQPDKMTKEQAAALLKKMVGMAPFQECASTPGTMHVLTCSKKDDSCGTKPEAPDLVDAEMDGGLSQADVNWRISQVRTFHNPGDYGVTATMATNASFAAVTNSVSEFVTSVGSCKTTGSCLYRFAVTDKTSPGTLGARKRTSDKARFTLYSVLRTATQPSVSYVSPTGQLDMAAYKADPTRGTADPLYVSTQRFIFHPIFITKQVTGNIATHVLLEYANAKKDAVHPENDYIPLMLPTSLPPGTPGWYPYGDSTQTGKSFYISGGCDVNSRWCEYTIEVDLNVPRHPWGSAQEPRCWGFSLDQMAALDFNKMDLSKWINSLDFGTSVDGMSTKAADAMTKQATDTAQAFYGAMSTGTTTNNPTPGNVALVTSADVLPNLSGADFAAYTLQAAVPSNWPAYTEGGPNNNPVTNVKVDWGDGTAVATMPKHAEGRAYLATHDYGDKPIGTYTVKVTLNTSANGPQTLTRTVSITPNNGGQPKTPADLSFSNPGTDGKSQSEYNPSATINGTSQAPANLNMTAPGMKDQFDRQGTTVTKDGGTGK